MIKVIKNLRKLSNAKLLVISNDQETKKSIEKSFEGYFKKLNFVSGNDEALKELKNSYDMLILDTSFDGVSFDDFSMILQEDGAHVPKIIISDDFNDMNILSAINMFSYSCLSKPLNLQDFKLSVIMCLNQTKRGDKIEFEKGFYYDEYREQFFNKNNKLIELTKLEYGLLKLLLDKKGELTDYDEIKKKVWKSKKMSVFTMRNVVNKVRQKMYYDIVKNHSNKGYTIGKFKN